MNTKKLTTLSLFLTLSLALYGVESLIPAPMPFPGVKPGLSNIVTLILLCLYGPGEALLVLLSRILLTALLFGQAMSFCYSLAGGILSFLVMYLLCVLLEKKYLPVAGAFGGMAHNAGQLFVAYLFTNTSAVFSYLPILMLSGAITGIFTGCAAHYSQKYLISKIRFMRS